MFLDFHQKINLLSSLGFHMFFREFTILEQAMNINNITLKSQNIFQLLIYIHKCKQQNFCVEIKRKLILSKINKLGRLKLKGKKITRINFNLTVIWERNKFYIKEHADGLNSVINQSYFLQFASAFIKKVMAKGVKTKLYLFCFQGKYFN